MTDKIKIGSIDDVRNLIEDNLHGGYSTAELNKENTDILAGYMYGVQDASAAFDDLITEQLLNEDMISKIRAEELEKIRNDVLSKMILNACDLVYTFSGEE